MTDNAPHAAESPAPHNAPLRARQCPITARPFGTNVLDRIARVIRVLLESAPATIT